MTETDADLKRKTVTSFVATVDAAELAVRMAEAFLQRKRPEGLTAAEALEHLEPETRDGLIRASAAVLLYWRETIEDAQKVN